MAHLIKIQAGSIQLAVILVVVREYIEETIQFVSMVITWLEPRSDQRVIKEPVTTQQVIVFLCVELFRIEQSWSQVTVIRVTFDSSHLKVIILNDLVT